MNDTTTGTDVIPAPAGVLAAYHWFADAVLALPADAWPALGDAYDRIPGRRRRRIAGIAQHASDLAYDLGRIHVPGYADLPEDLTTEDYDAVAAGTVVGVPERTASIAALLKLDETLGLALIVGLAVLTHDQLDASDYEMVTGWWAAAGGPLPSTHTITGTVRPDPATTAGPPSGPPRRRRVDPPPGATPPREQPRERPARTHYTRTTKAHPVLLGWLIVLLILAALGSLALTFAMLAMGNGVEVWLTVTAATTVGASVTASIRQHTIVKQRR